MLQFRKSVGQCSFCFHWMVDTFVSDFDQAREAGHLMKTKILFTLGKIRTAGSCWVSTPRSTGRRRVPPSSGMYAQGSRNLGTLSPTSQLVSHCASHLEPRNLVSLCFPPRLPSVVSQPVSHLEPPTLVSHFSPSCPPVVSHCVFH